MKESSRQLNGFLFLPYFYILNTLPKTFLMPEDPKTFTSTFDTGSVLFAWEAYEFFPYQRGIIWLTFFYGSILGFVLWGIFTRDWWLVAPLAIVGVLSIFFLHKSPQIRTVEIYENYLHVGRRYYAWSDFEGYWFVYDERQAVAVINFEFKGGQGKKLTLQMADLKPDTFRKVLSVVELTELEEKKESLIDLWSRVLKL